MHTLILAGNAETHPRASLIVGVLCLAVVAIVLYAGYRKITKR